MDGIEEQPALTTPLRERATRRLRLAYLSPLPPTRSGIADYSRELLPHLSRHASITLFTDDPEAVDEDLQARFDVKPTGAYAAQRWQFDVPVYQMGNSAHHDELYRVMCRYPGVLVLHDFVIHHFMAHHTLGHHSFIAYARELGYARGLPGIEEAFAIYRKEARNRLDSLALSDRAIDLNLGILVHNNLVRQRIMAMRPQSRVYVVPAPIAEYDGSPQRDQLPWSPGALIFASFGQITANKQMDRVLRLFSQLRRRQPRAKYLIVGEVLPEVYLDPLLRELELVDDVYITGFVPTLQAFANWLATADVVLNLRYPTLGETSAAALRAMVAGRPLVVYDHGWYEELPDDAVLKVPPLNDDALLSAMESLAHDGERRATLGRNARTYARTQHDPALTAGAYMTAIEQILSHSRGRHA